ncbi:MAG: helix-turn-helix transcriptional regulator [Pseudonocardiales bacterium]|nr:helix-turn-helix transcriptional regulator [Pseudonocardiales bacterium]
MEFDVVGTVRRVRRIADLSQRELAAKASVSHSTVARIEAGTVLPSLAMLDRLLAVAGLELAIVDHEYRLVLPMLDRDDIRDGAERRYPSHLDTVLDPRPGEWWGDRYGLARPPETFRRSRAKRDAQRRLSVWDVRVAQMRHVPYPGLPRG